MISSIKATVLMLSIATVIGQYLAPYRRKYYHSNSVVHWSALLDWQRERNPIMDQFLSEINEDIARRYNLIAESASNFRPSNSYTAIPAACKILYNNGRGQPPCDNPYPKNTVVIIRPEYDPLPWRDYDGHGIPFLCRKLRGVKRCRFRAEPREMKVNVYVMDRKGKAVKINEQIPLIQGNELNVLLSLDPFLHSQSVHKSSEPLKPKREENEENRSGVHEQLPEVSINGVKEYVSKLPPVEYQFKTSFVMPTTDANVQESTSPTTTASHLNKENQNEEKEEPPSDDLQLIKRIAIEEERKPVMNDTKKDEEQNGDDKLKEDNGEKKEKNKSKPKEGDVKKENDHETGHSEEETKNQEKEEQKEEPSDRKENKGKGEEQDKTVSRE